MGAAKATCENIGVLCVGLHLLFEYLHVCEMNVQTDPLSKLLGALSGIIHIPVEELVMKFDGIPIELTKTPADLLMEEDGMLVVVRSAKARKETT